MSNIISIPVKPYIKKWLMETHMLFPLDVSEDNDICRFIFRHVSLCIVPENDIIRMIKENKYDESIDLLLPTDASSNCSISVYNTIKINTHLVQLFNRSFYEYLHERCNKRNDIKNNIFDFMEFFEITDDDIDYDSLRKKYFRYRRKLKSQPKIKHKKIIQNESTLSLFN